MRKNTVVCMVVLISSGATLSCAEDSPQSSQQGTGGSAIAGAFGAWSGGSLAPGAETQTNGVAPAAGAGSAGTVQATGGAGSGNGLSGTGAAMVGIGDSPSATGGVVATGGGEPDETGGTPGTGGNQNVTGGAVGAGGSAGAVGGALGMGGEPRETGGVLGTGGNGTETGGSFGGGAGTAGGPFGTGGDSRETGGAPGTGGDSGETGGVSGTSGDLSGGMVATGGDTNEAGGTPGVGGNQEPAGGATGDGGESSGSGGGGNASPGCGSASTTSPCSAKGTTCSLNIDSTERTYYVQLPQGYDSSRPYPVVFQFHPWGGSADQALTMYQLNSKMPDAIYVTPQGLDAGGAGAGWANTGGVDIAFTEAMVQDVQSKYCVDNDRIFSTGFSYGGMMSFAIGCEMSDVFRAIAPMAGSLYSDFNCQGTGPAIAMWGAHGTSDTVVPPEDGRAARDKILQQSHCGTETTPVEPSPCVKYQGCDPGYDVTWCEWDGPHGIPSFGSAAIAEFFMQF